VSSRASLRVAAVQRATAFLDREAATGLALDAMTEAAGNGAQLIAFPETHIAGYPFWADITNASHFNDADQKAAWGQYLDSTVDVARGDLDPVVAAAADLGLFVYLGIAERSASGSSIYCSLVAIDPELGIVGVHRKLKPTYGERLMWADGDGHGLKVHETFGTRVSGLNCWENWMPLARAAMYAQGTQVHVSVWPGSPALTHDNSRLIALEGRVFVVAAGGVLRQEHLPADFPLREAMGQVRDRYASGGAIIVAPDGTVLAAANKHEETILYADLDLTMIGQERHNFDPSGHYSRADVLSLTVDRRRRDPAVFIDDCGL